MAIYRKIPSCGASLKLDRTFCFSWNNSTHFGFVFKENLSAMYNLFAFENGIDILERSGYLQSTVNSQKNVKMAIYSQLSIAKKR